jgi:hypothetical protein
LTNKYTAFLPQIFVLFGTGAVSPPPSPTHWGEGRLIGPPHDIRYFSINNLLNKLISLGGPIIPPFLDCWCSALEIMHKTSGLEVPPEEVKNQKNSQFFKIF